MNTHLAKLSQEWREITPDHVPRCLPFSVVNSAKCGWKVRALSHPRTLKKPGWLHIDHNFWFISGSSKAREHSELNKKPGLLTTAVGKCWQWEFARGSLPVNRICTKCVTGMRNSVRKCPNSWVDPLSAFIGTPKTGFDLIQPPH